MTDERLANLVRAKRYADEASEALRRMIEHDLAIRVPDGPELQALRLIADCRLQGAMGCLGRALEPAESSDIDGESWKFHTSDITDMVAVRRRP